MENARYDSPVGYDVYVEVQTFLHREAEHLDNRDYQQWLAMLTSDVHYQLFARVIREAGASRIDYALIDEDTAALARRVEQISNPKLTHAENPPSFTRRFVSNLQAFRGADGGHYTVKSNILLYRHRLETPEGALYAGARQDVLRRVDGGLKLAHRHVILDQAAFAGSVTTLF